MIVTSLVDYNNSSDDAKTMLIVILLHRKSQVEYHPFIDLIAIL